MTAFITHCLKNARLDLIGWLFCVGLAWVSPGWVFAQSLPTEISQIKLERADQSLLLSTTVQFELSPAVEDALHKGVAMVFFAEASVYRKRWYWTNKKIANAERHMRLTYQPLTRRWRLNVAAEVITNAAMALNQSFESLPEALAAVQRLSRWKIADFSDIDLEQAHLLDFSFRLDVSQLPRPFQIGTLGQSDWNISATARVPLVLEVSK